MALRRKATSGKSRRAPAKRLPEFLQVAKRRPFAVFLVVDDQEARAALAGSLRKHKLDVREYMTGREFLIDYRKPAVGILLADIRLRGMTWEKLLSESQTKRIALPIVFIAGHADSPAAVRAVRSGAFDFVTRPGTDSEILPVLMRAYSAHYDVDPEAGTEELDAAIQGVARISKREHQVLRLVCEGHSSREIAADLGISNKTVEAHRARINARLRTRTVSQILRVYLAFVHPED